MKKIYRNPSTTIVTLHLQGSVLEDVVIGTGSIGADPKDSLSKKHNSFFDSEEDEFSTKPTSLWD